MLFFTFSLQAQISKKAQQYFDDANYDIGLNRFEEAKRKLLIAVESSPNFAQAHLFLANTYYQLGEYANAIPEYEYTLKQPSFPNKVHIYLAKCYFETHAFDKTIEAIDRYLSNDKITEANRLEANQIKINAAFSAVAIQKPVPFEPFNLGENVNSADDEYLASLNADESIVLFTRKINGQEDLYQTGRIDGTWKLAEVVEEEVISTGHNEGAHCISADGKLLLITICNKNPTIGSCDIYVSKKSKKSWSEPVNIGKPINSVGWDAQPSLSADGKSIYFVSNRAGGFGGKDIWVSHNSEGIWNEPINLGPTINTVFDEQTPFIHFDNETLYFSSDGHPGLGKQDVYFSRKVNNVFTTPVNFGYPINTSLNESGISISLDGQEAFFAAERTDGLGGLDIYQFKTPIAAQPKRVTYVKATILDEQNNPLAAHYTLTDLTNNETILNAMDEDGNLLIALPSGREYALHVKKEGYLFESYHFQLKDTVERKAYVIEIALSPLVSGEKTVLNNVFFELDSYTLMPNSFLELNNLVELLVNYPNLQLEISGHTDNIGTSTYNLELSQKRAESVVKYLVDKGIASNRLIAKGYGSTQPNFSNDTAEGRLKNRRTEFKVIP
jgi:outer membrane protein OmpA-like peptidoglycan-associated protein/tetratricopeptide (TPR) repeat protein